jgi:hypothetical protein
MGTKINVQDKGKIGKINITERGDIVNSARRQSPWISGSFYLALFIIIIAAIVVIAKLLPFYTLPVIIVGTMLLFSVIGAFQLRNDEKLSQKNFLELMLLAFKNIPFLVKKNTTPDA